MEQAREQLEVWALVLKILIRNKYKVSVLRRQAAHRQPSYLKRLFGEVDKHRPLQLLQMRKHVNKPLQNGISVRK